MILLGNGYIFLNFREINLEFWEKQLNASISEATGLRSFAGLNFESEQYSGTPADVKKKFWNVTNVEFNADDAPYAIIGWG